MTRLMLASREGRHRPFWKLFPLVGDVEARGQAKGSREATQQIRRFRRTHVKGAALKADVVERRGRKHSVPVPGGANAGKGIVGYATTFKAEPLEDARNRKRRRRLKGGCVFVSDVARPRTRTRGGRRLV